MVSSIEHFSDFFFSEKMEHCKVERFSTEREA